jgi:predicted TPR repeat methyltransferase
MDKIDETVAGKCGRMANEYDRRKKEQGWFGPEVVFGLMYEFVNSGETVLDIGIGTGFGSLLLHKAGLNVFGMDMSPEMLEVCRSKGFAEDLKVHDLTEVPYPYSSASFDHIVCVGVLNHFENLQPVFTETLRILKEDGIFAFIVADRNKDENASFQVEHENTKTIMYRHSTEQIKKLLQINDFISVKELEFFVSGHKEKGSSLRLKAYAAARKKRI